MEAIKHFFAQEEKKTSASFSFMRNQRREAEERMGLGRNGIYYISDKKFYQHYFKLVGIPTFSLGKKKKIDSKFNRKFGIKIKIARA